ncbi:MAG TPA: histidine phosphatase family protein [Myxococcota bacterium]|nr:histidine phosphatase family protein [Myxococcota bacterium]
MKTLLLLRHAKAEPASPGASDRERPLRPEGRAAALAMARYLLERGNAPQLVLCSPSLRTVETLDGVRLALAPAAREQIDDALYPGDPDALLETLSGVAASISSVLMIGHNPGIQELACSLAVDGDREQRERMARKFSPGACARIDFDTDDWRALSRGGRLLDFVRPKDLRAEV